MLKQITQEETNRRYMREQISPEDKRCLRCYYCCKTFETDDNCTKICPKCNQELVEVGFLKGENYDNKH